MGVFSKLGNMADTAVEKAKEKVDAAADKLTEFGKEEKYAIKIDGVMPTKYGSKDDLVKALVDLGYVEVVDE